MTKKPLFSILHTSARPDKWRAVYDDWMSKAVHPEQVEYVLCIDPRWGFPPVGRVTYEDRGPLNLVVENTGRRCYVDGVNTAARVSSGAILIVNADDQFACEGWDSELTDALWREGVWRHLPPRISYSLPASLPLPSFVIEVSTGTPEEHYRQIMVMPILSRKRYEDQGSEVFYHGYESMCADNDFCEWAKQDGVVIDARGLMFPHKHPMFDSTGWKTGDWNQLLDKQYLEQNRGAAHQIGSLVLAWRRRVSFGKALTEAAAIEGWMFPDELECLSMWASQCQTIVEVGSWKGRSTYALCKGTAGGVTAVDTFRGTPGEPEHVQKVAAAGGSTLGEFERNTEGCENLSVWETGSVQAALHCGSVDMVFIDGGHSYEQVLADLKAWLPKVKHKGLICGHDFDHPRVAKAVREVLGEVERGAGSLWFKNVAAKRSIAMCYPGEVFQGAMVDALLNLYAHLVELDFAVLRVRSYSTMVHQSREDIRRTVMNHPERPDLILWMDDDNPLTPAQFDQLLSDLQAHPEVDGISGWCWRYHESKRGFSPSCGLWAPDHLQWQPFEPSFAREIDLKPFECGGFPCFLMRLSALEKAGDSPFLPILDNRLEHGMLGEDFSFFLRAEKGGAKFLVDPKVRVQHLRYVDVEPVFEAEGAPAPVKVACMMRVRNEGRWLKRVIDAVRPLCRDEIYIMEDGSSDNTVEVIQSAGVHLIPSPFVGQGLDERRDKQWLLQQVRIASQADWIFMPDGDEELEPGGCEKIRRTLESNPNVDCFALRILNLWDSVDQIRLDGGYGRMGRQSLFRAQSELVFKSYYEGTGKNHVGLHVSNAPGLGGARMAPLNVALLHYGPLHKADRIRKYRWINELDPHNAEEDFYRHMVQGDIPEVPWDAKLKHGGPLELRKLPAHLIPKFKDGVPGPLVDAMTAAGG